MRPGWGAIPSKSVPTVPRCSTPASLFHPCLAVPPLRPSLLPSAPTPNRTLNTGSAKPLVDLCAYGFVFSYALSWPRE